MGITVLEDVSGAFLCMFGCGNREHVRRVAETIREEEDI